MVYHNDVTILDRNSAVQWRTPAVQGEPPTAREYHTLTTVSPSRALLFGGQSICWENAMKNEASLDSLHEKDRAKHLLNARLH